MDPKPPDYFEGTLQLRNVNEDVIDFAVSEIENSDVNIAKTKHLENGIDIYISRQRFLRTIAGRLQKRFGGQIIVSRKLHTKSRLTGRDLYRVNVLFRLPYFKKGDVIEYKGDKIRIINRGKKIFAKNIATGKKLNLSYKDLLRYSLLFL